MNTQPARRRRSFAIFAMFVLAAFAVLIWLGTWQLQRKTEKEALIEAIGTQLAAPPMRMPEQSEWETLSPVRAEFRRVRFQGEFLHGQEALVYTSGSAFRPDVKGPGYWVFTPVRTVDGDMVAVNRGFVPDGKQNPKARADGQIDGVVTIVGTIRWPERRGRFTPNDDPAHNIWYTRDHVAMAAAKNWGNVAPFYVEQESPAPPGGLPQVGPTVAKLPNNHLQYAITWYGLAMVLVVAFFFWTRARLRERREAPP